MAILDLPEHKYGIDIARYHFLRIKYVKAKRGWEYW